MARHIVQIAVSSPPVSGDADVIYALASDGSLWKMIDDRKREWREIPPLPIPETVHQ